MAGAKQKIEIKKEIERLAAEGRSNPAIAAEINKKFKVRFTRNHVYYHRSVKPLKETYE